MKETILVIIGFLALAAFGASAALIIDPGCSDCCEESGLSET